MDDLISRQALCEYALSQKDKSVTPNDIMRFPSAQPELTDDLAIEHLQSTGWMQNHDKEMYEKGLRERLADDSDSYDSLIPSGDTILRQAAIDAFEDTTFTKNEIQRRLSELPSAQPEPCEDAVSRQAVINIINKPVIIKAKEQIEALPSVLPERKQMTNKEWIDFLSVQFDISRTSAREMLHSMMQCKKEDNYKKQFNRRWEQE